MSVEEKKRAISMHLCELEKRALDESYVAHLGKLWSVWLSQPGQGPDHAMRGAMLAREAYALVFEAIEDRMRALQRAASMGDDKSLPNVGRR